MSVNRTELAVRLAALPAEKRALLELRLQRQGITVTPPRDIAHRRNGDTAPLTVDQQFLWYFHQLAPHSPAYNISFVLTLTGDLSVAALKSSFTEIVRRHEMLRSTIDYVDGEPQHRVHAEPRFAFAIEEWSEKSDDGESAYTEWAERRIRESANEPFDLATGPLLRVRLFQQAMATGPSTHYVVTSLHHIATDRVSFDVLLHELFTLYPAVLEGRPAPLPELSIQYGDYAVWQRGYLQGKVLEDLSEFWEGYLCGVPFCLDLPTDRLRPALQSLGGRRKRFAFSLELQQALAAVAVQRESSRFMLYLTAFAILLYRHSQQDDIVIGTPIANRHQEGTQNLIGFLLNFLAIRLDLSGNPTFEAALHRTRESTLSAYAHQEMPFGKVVELLELERDVGVNPVFQCSIIYLDQPPNDSGDLPSDLLPGVELQFRPVMEVQGTRFDLTLAIWESSRGLNGFYEYNSDLWDEESIDFMVSHLQCLLEAIAKFPDATVDRIPLSKAAESDPPFDFPESGNNTSFGPDCLNQATTWALAPRCEVDLPGSPPSGRVVPGWQAYVVDDSFHRVAKGIRGELMLGGWHLLGTSLEDAGVAAEQLIPHPWSLRPGQRLLRTGDICRQELDGRITLYGKRGRRRRIRGVTVDMDQLERVIEMDPSVAQAAINEESAESGPAGWCVVVVPQAGELLSLTDLQRKLARRIPAFLIPSRFKLRTKLSHEAGNGMDRIATDGECSATSILSVAEDRIDELCDRTNLTKNQFLIWASQSSHPDLPLYNISFVIWLNVAVDAEQARQAVAKLYASCEVLRTVIDVRDGLPRAHVSPRTELCFEVEEFTGEDGGSQSFHRWAEERSQRCFDISTRMFECVYVALSDTRCGLYVKQHHLITDGWSCGLLATLLSRLCREASEGRLADQVEIPAFAKYARIEGKRRQAITIQDAKVYWRHKLNEQADPVDFYGGASPKQSFCVDRVSYELGTVRSQCIRHLATGHRFANKSVFGVFASVLLTFLHRISGSRRLAIGTPLLNRPPKFRQTLGLFMQVVPLRFTIAYDETFTTLFQKISSELRETMRYQRYVTGNPVQRPTYDVVLNYEFMQVCDDLGNPAASETFYKGYAQESLGILIRDYESSGNFTIDFDFSREIFDERHRKLTWRHFVRTLDAMLANPDQRLCDVDLLSAEEYHELTEKLSHGHQVQMRPPCVVSRIEHAAEEWPDHIALVDGERMLSFGRLNSQANALAEHLIDLGVGPEQIVAICIPKSLETVICILAVWKAGAAYVPLDPRSPAERLRFVLRDSQASVCISKGHAALVNTCVEHVVDVDSVIRNGRPRSAANHPRRQLADRLAYFVYTSGSSGQSKGVMVPQSSLANVYAAWEQAYELDRQDVHLQMANFTFDVWTGDFVRALCSGGTLLLCPHEKLLVAEDLHELMESYGVTCAEFVPAVLRNLVRHLVSSRRTLRCMRLLIVGSDSWYADEHEHLCSMLPETVRFVHSYGVTEATIDSCYFEGDVDVGKDAMTPVGRPFDSAALYVLTRNWLPAPKEVPGELYLAGPALARGYHGRPAETAERFLPHPFGRSPGQRLYKTGDRVRWLNDGNLQFLGRYDAQIKMRGFRVELGEIESILRQHRLIREAIVTVHTRDARNDNKQLVGYVVAKDGEFPTSHRLRRDMLKLLPEYMVPSLFAVVAEFPRTANGKLDWYALEKIVPRAATSRQVRGPETNTERMLLRLCQETLGLDNIGVDDNFFELGGDSILGIRFLSRAKEAGFALSPQDLFQYQTVSDLAQVADDTKAEHESTQGEVAGSFPLTPIQEAFFEWKLKRPHHFNQSLMFSVDKSLRWEHFCRSWGHLLRRHDSLRLRFRHTRHCWEQLVVPFDESLIAECCTQIDLSQASPEAQRGVVERTAEELERSLNLETGPLLRVIHFDLGPAMGGRLLVVVHHLVVDGVSWRTLVEDALQAYAQSLQGLPIELPRQSASYQQWATKLFEYAQTAEARDELVYWQDVEAVLVPDIPPDRPSTDNRADDAAVLNLRMTSEQTQSLLRRAPRIHDATLYELMLAALVVALQRWTHHANCRMDLEGHGREPLFDDIDISRTLGWFTAIFPVVFDCTFCETPDDVLASVRQTLRTIPRRGIGYGILRHLTRGIKETPRLGSEPTSQICFNYLGQFPGESADSGPLSPAPESCGPLIDGCEERLYSLDVIAVIREGRLRFDCIYSTAIHNGATIRRLAANFLHQLGQFADPACLEPRGTKS